MFRISLCTVVATRAQTLQCTEPELRWITMMRLDVVSGGGSSSNASLSTKLTPRFVLELELGSFAPSAQAVPRTPGFKIDCHGSGRKAV
jgi:hypothetical protein